MVDFSAITNAANVNRGTADASSSLADNFEMFLTLLTEQMKNQDPLNPLESNEFVNQLVQFSSVEQQINQNQNLESLLALQAAAAQGGAVSYIGKDATVASNDQQLEGGQADWRYVLSREAESVSILVKDSRGRIVDRAEGATGAGAQSFNWDGVDQTGLQLPDGEYSLEITALDAEGGVVGVEVQTTGRVTGVDLSGEDVILEIGGVRVPLTSVRSLQEARPTS